MIHDVIIIGGGAAGLSAALTLGRFRRKVVLFDTQRQANRFSHAAHNFFTRDGTQPAELIAIGREQLRRYETVEIQFGEIANIMPEQNRFRVTTGDGAAYDARKILLATGLKDTLPAVAGLDRYWGHGVFHCPYCDGWEQRDQPLAILTNGDQALHYAKLLHALTDDLVICTNGTATFNEVERASLAKNQIRLIETPLSRVEGTDTQLERIIFADGQSLPRSAIFTRPESTQHSVLAAALGCAMTPEGLVQVNELGSTSVPGVYAAGDMSARARQLAMASMQGAMAGAGINAAISSEDF